jgi:hypothetical protein
VRSRYLVVVVVVADVCACGPAGLGMQVSVYVSTLLAASDVWGRVVVRYDCHGGGGCCLFVCLFVTLFVATNSFIAALAACLCGWLIVSARHGTADNDDVRGDDATRLRVFGGTCWVALADVRLGARRPCVRV